MVGTHEKGLERPFCLRAEHGYFTEPSAPFRWRLHPEMARAIELADCKVRSASGVLQILAAEGGALPGGALAFGLEFSTPDALTVAEAVVRDGVGPLGWRAGDPCTVLTVSAFELTEELGMAKVIPVVVQDPSAGQSLTIRFSALSVIYVYNFVGWQADSAPTIRDAQGEVMFSDLGQVDVGGGSGWKVAADSAIPMGDRAPQRFSLVLPDGFEIALPTASPGTVSRPPGKPARAEMTVCL